MTKPSIADVRAKFPQYEDLSDEQLLEGVRRKFYGDVPREKFFADFGLTAAPAPAADRAPPRAPRAPEVDTTAPAPLAAPEAALADLMAPSVQDAPPATPGVPAMPVPAAPAAPALDTATGPSRLMEAAPPQRPDALTLEAMPKPDTSFTPRATLAPADDPLIAAMTAPQPAPAATSSRDLTGSRAPSDPFEGEGLVALAKRRGQQFVSGLTDVIAAVPEAIGITGEMADRSQVQGATDTLAQRSQIIADIEAQLADPNLDPAVRGFLMQNLQDLGAGQGVIAQEIVKPIVPAQARDVFAAGDAIRTGVQDVVGAPDPRDRGFWGQVASGAGNMTGMIGASAAGALVGGPVGGLTVGAMSGAAMNQSQVFTEALDSGVDQETALQAAKWATLIGASEIIPINRALKLLPPRIRGELTQGMMRKFVDIAQGAGEEAAQEYLATVANNIVAQQLYDPERGWTEGATEAALVGAVLGAAVGTAGVAIEGRGDAAPPVTVPPRAPEQPPTPEEELASAMGAAPAAPAAPAQPETPAQPAQPQGEAAPAAPAPAPEQELAAAMGAEPAPATPQDAPAPGGRFEILDEIENTPGGPVATGRKVRIDLETGQATVVGADDTPAQAGGAPGTGNSASQQPQAEDAPTVGAGDVPPAAGRAPEDELAAAMGADSAPDVTPTYGVGRFDRPAEGNKPAASIEVSREGPFDFAGRYPAPDPRLLDALEREGRNTFEGDPTPEQVASILDDAMADAEQTYAATQAWQAEAEQLAKVTKPSSQIPTGKNNGAAIKLEIAQKAVQRGQRDFDDTVATIADVWGMDAAQQFRDEAIRRAGGVPGQPIQWPNEGQKPAAPPEAELAAAMGAQPAPADGFDVGARASRFPTTLENVATPPQKGERGRQTHIYGEMDGKRYYLGSVTGNGDTASQEWAKTYPQARILTTDRADGTSINGEVPELDAAIAAKAGAGTPAAPEDQLAAAMGAAPASDPLQSEGYTARAEDTKPIVDAGGEYWQIASGAHGRLRSMTDNNGKTRLEFTLFDAKTGKPIPTSRPTFDVWAKDGKLYVDQGFGGSRRWLEVKPVSKEVATAPFGSSSQRKPDTMPEIDAIDFEALRRDTARTPTGTEIEVEYAIIELDDMIASNLPDGRVNPNYPQERQPRDRTKDASERQIQRIMRDFDPRQLLESPTTDTGAMIVDKSGYVESGNGRTLALQRIFSDRPDLTKNYVDALRAGGYPIDGMDKPVLVRIRRTQMTPAEIEAYTRESNTDTKLAMSLTEQAMADAAALPDSALDLYRGGDIDTAGNRDFVRAFIQAVVTENEQGKMIAPDGSMSQDAVRRIQGALLAKAYGDPALVAKLMESADSNIKSIGGALLDVSASWAQMRSAARAGSIAPEMDQTDALLEAVRLVDRARSERRNVIEYVKQPDLLSGEGISPMGQRFLALMFKDTRQWTRPAGRDNLARWLGYYVEEAMKSAPGADLFGAQANPGEALDLAKEKQDADEKGTGGNQADLFAPRPAGSDGPSVRPADGGGDRPGPQGTTAQDGEQRPAGQPEGLKPPLNGAEALDEALRLLDGPRTAGFDSKTNINWDFEAAHNLPPDLRKKWHKKAGGKLFVWRDPIRAESDLHVFLIADLERQKKGEAATPTPILDELQRALDARTAFLRPGESTAPDGHVDYLMDATSSLWPLMAKAQTEEERRRAAGEWVKQMAADNNVEYIVVFDRYGEVIAALRGTKNAITFPNYINRARDSGTVGYSIHNHPANRGVSAPDLKMLMAGMKNLAVAGTKSQKGEPLGEHLVNRGPALVGKFDRDEMSDLHMAATGALAQILNKLVRENANRLRAALPPIGSAGYDSAGKKADAESKALTEALNFSFDHIMILALARAGILDYTGNSAEIARAVGVNPDDFLDDLIAAIKPVARRLGLQLTRPRDQGRDRAPGSDAATDGGSAGPDSGTAGVPGTGNGAGRPDRGSEDLAARAKVIEDWLKANGFEKGSHIPAMDARRGYDWAIAAWEARIEALKAARAAGGYPEPNENFVYSSDDVKPGDFLKLPAPKRGNSAEIEILEVAPGQWVEATHYQITDAGGGGPLTVTRDGAYPSREAALAKAVATLRRQMDSATKNASNTGAQMTQARKILTWLDTLVTDDKADRIAANQRLVRDRLLTVPEPPASAHFLNAEGRKRAKAWFQNTLNDEQRFIAINLGLKTGGKETPDWWDVYQGDWSRQNEVINAVNSAYYSAANDQGGLDLQNDTPSTRSDSPPKTRRPKSDKPSSGNADLDAALDDIFGDDDVSGTGDDLERDSGDAGTQDDMGGTDVPPAAGGSQPGAGKRGGKGGGTGGKSGRRRSIPGGDAAPVGGAGDSGVDAGGGTKRRPAAGGNGGRGAGAGAGGLSPDAGRGGNPAGTPAGGTRVTLTDAERAAAIRDILKENLERMIDRPGFAEGDGTRIDTPAFRRWFGDSKVVDRAGRPLVVYHGTDADFEAFAAGSFFAEEAALAAGYGQGDQQRIVTAYLSITNPATGADVIRVAENLPGWTDDFADEYPGIIFNQVPGVMRALRQEGFDGAYFMDGPGGDSDAPDGNVWVAFQPTQIKSTFNRGTFDPNDGNMLAEGDGLDPRKYEALETLFIDGMRAAGADAAKMSDRDMFRAIAAPLKNAGLDRETIVKMAPYLEAFTRNVKSGRVNLDPKPDSSALDRLNAVVPGWTAMNGMLTNPDPQRGAIIDQEIVSKKWFVVLMGSTRDINNLDTVDQAVDWYIENHGGGRPKAKIKPVMGDEANIRATLPQLLPEQQGDVVKIEARFAKPDGHGMLITNGTGTGKTFTGGGQIKRFVEMGKGDILIIAPSEAVIAGWKRALDALGVPVNQLRDTRDAGQGVVITTYANLEQNNALATRSFDLVVADESQNLMSNKDGTPTGALHKLRAITHRPEDLWQKSRMLHADAWAKAAKMKDGEPKQQEYGRLRKIEEAEVAKWSAEPRSKVLFLSATPFAYDKTVDYAEGYLFQYPKDGNVGRSRQDGRALFMIQNFGYRIRYHKLTKPESAVDSAVFEREFHEKLKREGVLSGRSLQVDVDYDRKFVTVADAIGTKIDAVLKSLSQGSSNKDPGVADGYRTLHAQVMKKFNYIKRMQLLEAIKAKAAVDDIRAHLALGRKVVVFHDYNVGGGFNPFGGLAILDDANAIKALADLMQQHPDLNDLDFTFYDAPAETLKNAFGNRASLFSGLVPQKQRLEGLTKFNTDDSGTDILVVQSDAGGAGISMHDLTGTHQRVLINLGMPTKPTTTLQEEGRILRVGTLTDAIFRYYTIGTAWERAAFAQRIAERSGTVENLALGNEARMLRDAFIDAYVDAEPRTPSAEDGKGGKAKDGAAVKASPYEIAKTHYFGKMKVKGRRDQREGIDFYSTPEPLGFKMVQWAGARSNERVLEPSAGDGAIARYFPENVAITMVEPSNDLGTRALLRAPTATLQGSTFEDYHLVNKHHVIVMNPPFGSGGATAVEHLAKAARHLRDGGRLVALIPTGPSADKRFDAWWNSDDAKEFNWTADIALPAVAFERAGTNVMTRIVILDKISDKNERAYFGGDNGGTKRLNFTGAKDITEFFDRLENYDVPRRPEPKRDVLDELEAETQTADTPAPSVKPGPALTTGLGGFKLGKTKHAKTGDDLFVATIANRVERDVYNALNAVARSHGGWYSNFRGNGAIPGFQFKSEESRAAFLEDAAKPTVNNDPEPEGFEERAYHGTPHDFDRFSLDAIGTGEGAQAYGWGLYFASQRNIAEHYRKKLGRSKLRLNGKELPSFMTGYLSSESMGQIKAMAEADPPSKPAEITDDMDSDIWEKGSLQLFPISLHRTLNNLKDKISYSGDNPQDRLRIYRQTEEAYFKAAKANNNAPSMMEHGAGLAAIDWLSARTSLSNPSRLYTVELPDSEMLLDWDAKPDEQPPKVQEALEPVMQAMRSYYQGRSNILMRGLEGFMNTVDGSDILSFIQANGATYGLEPDGYTFTKRTDPGKSYVVHEVRNAATGALLGEGDGRAAALSAAGIRKDRYASLVLRKLGIPGHRYPDASSRNVSGVLTPDGSDASLINSSALMEIMGETSAAANLSGNALDDALSELLDFFKGGTKPATQGGKEIWEELQGKGWTYVSQMKSHNFVIYDDSAVSIVQKEQKRQMVREAQNATQEILRIMPRLRAELDRLDLKRVKLYFDPLEPDWQGMFQVTGDGDFEVIIGASLDPMKTLHHEVIHILRTMNLFTAQEWRALELAATRGWMEKHDIAARYPTLLPSEQIEEAIAEEFSWALEQMRPPKGSALVLAFNKIHRILKAIRNVFQGAGFQTAEDIFGRILAGEISKRQAQNTGYYARMGFNLQAKAPRDTATGDLFAAPEQPKTSGMTADQRREMEARAQQSKMRKVGGNSGDAGPLFDDQTDLFGQRRMFQAKPVGIRPLTAQGRAHRNTAMAGPLFIPDRRVWDELTRAGVPVWQRLRGAAGGLHDAIDRARYLIQDRFLPVLRAQEAVMRATGKPLPADHNAYLTETTFSGKVGRHLFEIDEDYTKPIIDLLAETKGELTAEAVGEWLYARHAQERNAYIASINPTMPDGGSGMTDQDAQQILSDAANGPHAARLQKIGGLIDRLRERNLALRESAGLITADEANLWRKQYKFYVPLKGFAETDHAEAVLDVTGVGKRFSIRGQETRRALGRSSEAFNPLQAALTQAQEVAIRAEKNRVGQALYELAKDYPAPALWSVKKPAQKRYFNRSTGLVETRVEDPVSLILEPNEMALKVSGEEVRVMFHDERIARAVGTVGADQLGWFVAIMSRLSRWFSAVNTMMDPEFVIRNAFRDMTAAQINIRNFGEDDRNAIAKAMIRDWPKAFAAAYGGQKNKANTEWQKWYKAYEKAGGKISFWTMDQPEAANDDLKRRIYLAQKGLGPMAAKFTRISTRDNPLLGFIERTNLAVDNAIRLAAFVEARKKGWSEQDAAALAKNLTVNFNRRGEWGSTLNALFVFANASIQGTQIMLRALGSKRMAKYTLAMVAMGFILDQVNAALSEEDDDGELAYDKIPDFKNRVNLTIMLGPDSDHAATIWMPYGYSLFPYAGQQMSKIMRGVKDPGNVMADFGAAVMQSFSPLGGGTLQQIITPTVLDPINEMAMNEDWLGRPIRPENAYADYGPDAYKFYNGASDASKATADFLNKVTGGNEAEAGIIDVSPEYLDHAFGFVVGGAGRFWGRTVDLVSKAAGGNFDEIESRDIPFYRSLQYEAGDWLDRDRYYQFRDRVREARAAEKTYGEMGQPVPASVARIAGLYQEHLATERALKQLKGDPKAQHAVFMAFNKRYIAIMGRQGE